MLHYNFSEIRFVYFYPAPLQLQEDKDCGFNLLYCNFREIRLQTLGNKIRYLQPAPLQLQGDKGDKICHGNFNPSHCNFRDVILRE
ncbi:hypothetical protein J1N35_015749 [Gossypium stocksii]|uniref:Uncharacterized protein n=1 Tax=Gossypium stocksii TaxID=47602 RepID=A0A9D3VXG7_9ROSI|nr:hypothetical protein J1N35_015749 [Gossypium stocksii]